MMISTTSTTSHYCFFGTELSELSELGPPGTWDEGRLGGGWDGGSWAAGRIWDAGRGQDGAGWGAEQRKQNEQERTRSRTTSLDHCITSTRQILFSSGSFQIDHGTSLRWDRSAIWYQ